MSTEYQYIRHATYPNYILAQGYCDFQTCIDEGAYDSDFSRSDMEVVVGFPDPNLSQWRSLNAIKMAISSNKSKHYAKCLSEIKVLFPDPVERGYIFKQIQDLKPLFEVDDQELVQHYIQSCVDQPVLADPTLNQQLVDLLNKYFDFDYMQNLPFEDLQLLGDF